MPVKKKTALPTASSLPLPAPVGVAESPYPAGSATSSNSATFHADPNSSGDSIALRSEIDELKSEVREVLALLRAEKEGKGSGRKKAGAAPPAPAAPAAVADAPKQRGRKPKAQVAAAATTEAPNKAAKQPKQAKQAKQPKQAKEQPKEHAKKQPKAKAERREVGDGSDTDDSDLELRVRHRFYYVTLEAPAGTYGGDRGQVEELLVRNFTRLCKRGSYEVVAAVAAFEARTLTLHGVLRAAKSLPTTSAALANCNRTTIHKVAGEKVEYFTEGIRLRPLNKGKGSFITQEVLGAALKTVEAKGSAAEVCGSRGALFFDVPFEEEVEAGKRGAFDPATLSVSYEGVRVRG